MEINRLILNKSVISWSLLNKSDIFGRGGVMGFNNKGVKTWNKFKIRVSHHGGNLQKALEA